MQSVEQLWQDFVKQGGEPSATAFGVWLIREQPKLEGMLISPERKARIGEMHQPEYDTVQVHRNSFMPDGMPAGYQGMDVSVRVAIMVGRLERFLHYLTKSRMKESGMTEDEFVVLATLLYMPNTAKTQLLKQCLIEIPTGSELLKRMKKAGLIFEKQNPEDGRSTFINISAKGKQRVFRAFQLLGGVEDALADLSPGERETLLHLLDTLDRQHSRRHEIRQVSELMGESRL